ncbi:hypothetical protein P152DRAFT_6 [Eremomyces bilateralis CBS 781.70]|uniref:Uncharacterized protein n=1 Tax=Eremomyces bilateralis CBS 781.70 TaxID=1392243 RepID=A0A6G1GFG2_9PEZI|nr:uncharacterized protein P152DRAFT_6 [Eremomyces bilateralis CBS 781.70]KAF1816764.1 hypothetical protein P152DRAFT_6 [Eremomyces bilateralis CBS 781.70]
MAPKCCSTDDSQCNSSDWDSKFRHPLIPVRGMTSRGCHQQSSYLQPACNSHPFSSGTINKVTSLINKSDYSTRSFSIHWFPTICPSPISIAPIDHRSIPTVAWVKTNPSRPRTQESFVLKVSSSRSGFSQSSETPLNGCQSIETFSLCPHLDSSPARCGQSRRLEAISYHQSRCEGWHQRKTG